ncbi:thymidylate synthase [Marisediminicola sp. LYQ134]|uniref:thymidylate synthase n=1 Tax=Marisediminicola sp. LYQ134 TaxID=3391061 RepID=UPI003983CFF8
MDYRNAQSAFLSQAAEILSRGQVVGVRGSLTREVRQATITLRSPLERCIVVPGRNNNPFAAIYETLWVIAGRNDIEDLSEYLPRARDFSDDGDTWRAGYGPRLRAWRGFDQLSGVVETLTGDLQSRRAVISIYDPELDSRPSKDVPCTNWLQFTCRDGLLDLGVTVRSNDLVWGFSGINTFEWSVLQEMVAFWLGVGTGKVTYFIGSLHLYDRHFARVERMLSSTLGPDPYEAPAVARFATPLRDLELALAKWFELEAQTRTGRRLEAVELSQIADPLLRDFLAMINQYWSHQRGEPAGFDDIVDAGLRAAGIEFVSRDQARALTSPAPDGYLADFVNTLHRVKTNAYGDSWKRRGELQSILPNIARKIDRLERLDLENGAPLVVFDTAVDLFVYSVKHMTFRADVESRDGLASWSDGPGGFELLAGPLMSGDPHTVDVETARSMVLSDFRTVEELVDGGADDSTRAAAIEALAASAWVLLTSVARANPWVIREAATELAKFADWKE